jgi:hypothetical protein
MRAAGLGAVLRLFAEYRVRSCTWEEGGGPMGP